MSYQDALPIDDSRRPQEPGFWIADRITSSGYHVGTIMPAPHVYTTSYFKNFAREKFDQLAKEWREDTLEESSLTEIHSHHAYLSIIAMGRAAIPLILESLEREPDHWFAALKAVLRANDEDSEIVPESAYGNIQLMSEIWVQWGRDRATQISAG